MTFSFAIDLKVPFYDLDPMMIVWHGNYLKYFDRARFALFDAAGIDLYQYMVKEKYVFPITRTSTKHILPLRPNNDFTCKATVTEAHYKIAMDFEIRSADGRVYTRGSSEQVAVKLPDMELDFEIPPAIQKALGFD